MKRRGLHQKMLWGGESSERVRLEYPGEGTHPMHGPNYAKVPNPPQDFRYPIETAYISSIWCPPIYGDDLGLLFGGKNADRILKLLVREIELSEHVETAPRLR